MGGAGFVGTNLIKRLLKEGHEVQSLDNYSMGLKSNEVAKMFNINPIYKDAKPGEARDTLNTSPTAGYVLGWNPTRELNDYIIGSGL